MDAGLLLGGLGGVASGIGSFLGASKQAEASKEAAKMQAYTAMLAMQQQQKQYEQTRGDLAPFRDTGANAANMLTQQLPGLTAPITMDQATLERTPGYQFTLGQGLKATQSAAAARGLGMSGAALKGAANYATGLADNTYRSQFDMENINRTNAYNRLLGTSQMGATAAGNTGVLGANNANQQTNLLTGMGNAMGASQMAGANAASNQYGAIGNTIGNLGQLYNFNQLLGKNGGSAGMYGGGGVNYWDLEYGG